MRVLQSKHALLISHQAPSSWKESIRITYEQVLLGEDTDDGEKETKRYRSHTLPTTAEYMRRRLCDQLTNFKYVLSPFTMHNRTGILIYAVSRTPSGMNNHAVTGPRV